MRLLWLVALIGLLGGNDSASLCRHRHPRPHEVLHSVLADDDDDDDDDMAVGKRKRDVQEPTNLRIKLYYDDSVFRLTKEQFELINDTVLPSAVSYWSRALRVRRSEKFIKLSRKCEKHQVFFRPGDARPYCRNACESRTVCGEVVVPEAHLDDCRVCNAFGQECRTLTHEKKSGVRDADFVFYISATQTSRCEKGMTVAYAAHCQQESVLDRPIAGHANLCPLSISTKKQELDILLSTVKHEMLHALGFSISLFAFYRDAEGRPLTPRGENGKPPLNKQLETRAWSDRVIRTERRPWKVRDGYEERTVHTVVTPKVREEARRHYGCTQLEGAELEEQGEEGTVLTHWEKRLFENEAMTGTHTQNPIYSRLTLALMEDTGWYLPDYSMADTFSWGKDLGCEFVNQSCMQWMQSRSSRGQSLHPYCNKVKRDPLETECTDDRHSVALCNLVKHEHKLPLVYQNFESIPHVASDQMEYYGGSVALADYCPYIQEFTWRSNSVVVRGSQCIYEENMPRSDRNFALEKYGAASLCFDHTDRMWEERDCNQLRQWQHWGSGCYEYTCSEGRVHIHVLNHTFTCFYPQQEIEVSLLKDQWLHTGSLVCPSCEEVCHQHFRNRGLQCRVATLPPHSFQYPQDKLSCHALSLYCTDNNVLLLLLIATNSIFFPRILLNLMFV